ncbi:MAG: hypothetical protein M1132_09065 [Chloroflexi bacterium]|nr:hypothetical protein [Chloroflexota bacterium]
MITIFILLLLWLLCWQVIDQANHGQTHPTPRLTFWQGFATTFLLTVFAGLVIYQLLVILALG